MNHIQSLPKCCLLLLLLWPSLLSAAARAGDSSASGATPVRVVDIREFNSDERLSAVCLQGLANRSDARVYLNTGPSVQWMQFGFDDRKNGAWSQAAAEELKSRYASICDAWIDMLTRRGLYRFETVPMLHLLESQRPAISGVILYEKLDDDLAVAATMAGLRAALPMTPKVYEAWGRPLGLPVVFDVRSLYGQYDPKEERRLAAHRWALEHLFPDCRKNGALSRDRTYGLDAHDTLIDVDLAVANRWITYDLSYLSEETKNPHDRPHPQFGFDMPDTPIVKTILAGLEPFSPVYGWGRSERVTGTEGRWAQGRNPTLRGGGRGMGASAWSNKALERPEVPVAKVTGSSGNAGKGAVITVSGGARG